MFILSRLKENQPINNTGMAILDVGMLSSFGLPSEAAVEADFIRRVDRGPNKISLYLDSVSVKLSFFFPSFIYLASLKHCWIFFYSQSLDGSTVNIM